MAHDPAARETVITLLRTAGFTERVPPRRRDRDPEPASGFTAYTETDGTVLVCWVTPTGGNCASYSEVAESLKMAGAYAEACRAAGWTATIGGNIWHHARLTPPGDLTARLTEWIESEGIAKGELAAHVASSLAEDTTMRHLFETDPASRVLRDAATGVADLASMGLEAWVTENYHHGHLAEDMRR